MKQQNLTKIILFSATVSLFSCAGPGTDDNSASLDEAAKSMVNSEPRSLEEAEEGWQSNYGVGQIEDFTLAAEIDQSKADAGQIVYEAKCTACHKAEKQFIGPSPKGILARRTPAWVMNMILNPDEMIQKDPIARQLLIKFNGAPMANQSLTEDDARNVLEYFRTL